MQSTKNQKIEKLYFESFSQHFELPIGEIAYDDKPDVLIHGEGQPRMLGVEVCRLYKQCGSLNESQQQQLVKRLAVIERAEQIYLSRGGRKIALSISFDPQYPIMQKKHIKKVANDLASFAFEISSQRNGHQSHSPLEDTPELSWLYHDGKEYPNSSWEPVQSYDTPALLVTRVKKMVEEKTEKLRAYKPCGAYWLLLIVDFWDSSQDQGIHWPAEENVGQTPFERILIYKTCFNEVVEVSQRQ